MRYPIFLDLTGQPVVIVGGGAVATRKLRALLRAGAKAIVIAPDAGSAIRRLAGQKRIRWQRRRYRHGDLRRARLVIAATDDLLVNARVCAEAKRCRLLVNCAAPPDAGNFHVPATARCGQMVLAISTGGASPAFAKLLRRDLEHFLRAGYAQKLRAMSAARRARKRK
jgi:precorrin-2 dehydrogenase/sirohydrochlorin ferrochelatase